MPACFEEECDVLVQFKMCDARMFGRGVRCPCAVEDVRRHYAQWMCSAVLCDAWILCDETMDTGQFQADLILA